MQQTKKFYVREGDLNCLGDFKKGVIQEIGMGCTTSPL